LRSLFAGLTAALNAVEDARILVLPPPPIQGIGNAGGFTMVVELRDGSSDFAKLQTVTGAIVANAQTQSGCSASRPRSAPTCRNTVSTSTA